MDSILRNSLKQTSLVMNEDEVKKFKELLEILDKLFRSVIAVIALKATGTGDDFFTEHPIVTNVTVLMIVLFFWLWMLGTVFQHRFGCFLAMIFVCIILVIASICSVLVLSTVYPPIAWFTGMLWICIFGVIGCYYYQSFCGLFVCSVSDAIMKLIESHKLQSTRVPV